MPGKSITASRIKIKDRSLYIYLPSRVMADDWKNKAEKSGSSISKFVVEHVLDSLNHGENSGSNYVSRADLAKQLRDKEIELRKVRGDSELFKQLSEKLDNELKLYRAQPFLQDNFSGTRQYDRQLIQLLKSQNSVANETILEVLNIDPRQTDLVKAVKLQLENLQSFGLVEGTARGWKWVGGGGAK